MKNVIVRRQGYHQALTSVVAKNGYKQMKLVTPKKNLRDPHEVRMTQQAAPSL